jgi:ribosomal-protein-alanine N-acetyltransferase
VIAEILTGPCDVGALAALHAASFSDAWSEDWIGRLMAQPGIFAVRAEGGFVLARTAGDESEVLTLAVAPAARRRGIGSALILAAGRQAEQQGARKLFLEVSDANEPAKSLYFRLGFKVMARRKDYYPGKKERGIDALVLGAALPLNPVGNAVQFE